MNYRAFICSLLCSILLHSLIVIKFATNESSLKSKYSQIDSKISKTKFILTFESLKQQIAKIGKNKLKKSLIHSKKITKLKKQNKNQGKNSAKAKYLSKVYEEINKRKYSSRLLKKLKLQGTVEVSFDILSTGKLENITLKTPTPYQSLNQSAIKTIKRLQGNLDKFPDQLKENKLRVKAPINYKWL